MRAWVVYRSSKKKDVFDVEKLPENVVRNGPLSFDDRGTLFSLFAPGKQTHSEMERDDKELKAIYTRRESHMSLSYRLSRDDRDEIDYDYLSDLDARRAKLYWQYCKFEDEAYEIARTALQFTVSRDAELPKGCVVEGEFILSVAKQP